jgi:HlyD family secretion protein
VPETLRTGTPGLASACRPGTTAGPGGCFLPRRARRLLLAAATLLPLAGCGSEELELVGVVERTSLEYAAPASEEVVALPLPLGARVEPGTVLVRLDAEVATLETRAVEALHRAAQANLAAAESELRRAEQLRRSSVGTAQELDRARRQRDEAVGLEAERAARVAQAREALAGLTVASTVAGVLDQLPYDVGERVPLGGVVAVVVADETPWVRLWLPARAVARLAPGATATVEIEGFDDPLPGRLAEIAREPEYTPHFALTERERSHLVYESRVELPEAPAALRPGLPATVRLSLGSAAAEAASGAPDAGAGGG